MQEQERNNSDFLTENERATGGMEHEKAGKQSVPTPPVTSDPTKPEQPPEEPDVLRE